MFSNAMRSGTLAYAHRQSYRCLCDVRFIRYFISFFDYRCQVSGSMMKSFSYLNLCFSFASDYYSSAVAKSISNDCFALVFGFNTFLSLAFQSILTLVVVSEAIFSLDLRQQYAVYSGYFLVLTVLYGVVGLVQLKRSS